MLILLQFIFRASCGLSVAMLGTDSRQVSSGYFRNNCYVLLGLNALAAMVAWSGSGSAAARWPVTVAAVASYLGSVAWLLEAPRLGKSLLAAVAVASGWSAWQSLPTEVTWPVAAWLHWADPVAGGALLGTVLAAMLLGHWYLNSPGMQLEPLRRLTAALAAATLVRAGLGFAELAYVIPAGALGNDWQRMMILIRWLLGIGGTAAVTMMAWRTLRIPNTQSATGILYVGVLFVFTGELASQLLWLASRPGG